MCHFTQTFALGCHHKVDDHAELCPRAIERGNLVCDSDDRRNRCSWAPHKYVPGHCSHCRTLEAERRDMYVFEQSTHKARQESETFLRTENAMREEQYQYTIKVTQEEHKKQAEQSNQAALDQAIRESSERYSKTLRQSDEQFSGTVRDSGDYMLQRALRESRAHVQAFDDKAFYGAVEAALSASRQEYFEGQSKLALADDDPRLNVIQNKSKLDWHHSQWGSEGEACGTQGLEIDGKGKGRQEEGIEQQFDRLGLHSVGDVSSRSTTNANTTSTTSLNTTSTTNRSTNMSRIPPAPPMPPPLSRTITSTQSSSTIPPPPPLPPTTRNPLPSVRLVSQAKQPAHPITDFSRAPTNTEYGRFKIGTRSQPIHPSLASPATPTSPTTPLSPTSPLPQVRLAGSIQTTPPSTSRLASGASPISGISSTTRVNLRPARTGRTTPQQMRPNELEVLWKRRGIEKGTEEDDGEEGGSSKNGQ
ncbi:hypothetical protein BDV95DRAFT_232128 [Massariosphaeria phaeospora]|uniref:Uncharacterized protein n=1 Tax=Massariosphaeria phaeospora TaxID=100035 RepID=A0A7C8MTL7_9PLEO|nr:hypothetical protein BDV95DRAFT_232128 [Massariosphaeria phaeospora]